jgi:transcriptional regulator with XRE-family HTH domain
MDDKKHKQKRRLKAWLLLHGVEQKELALRLRISPQLLSMALSGRRMTRERFAALIAEGIPAELLPEPKQALAREKPETEDSIAIE